MRHICSFAFTFSFLAFQGLNLAGFSDRPRLPLFLYFFIISLNKKKIYLGWGVAYRIFSRYTVFCQDRFLPKIGHTTLADDHSAALL